MIGYVLYGLAMSLMFVRCALLQMDLSLAENTIELADKFDEIATLEKEHLIMEIFNQVRELDITEKEKDSIIRQLDIIVTNGLVRAVCGAKEDVSVKEIIQDNRKSAAKVIELLKNEIK